MKRKPITQYFYDGFTLANQGFDILFIALLLSIPSLVSAYAKDAVLSKIISSVWFIFALISFGFNLSIPVFLVYKQQRKVLSYNPSFPLKKSMTPA